MYRGLGSGSVHVSSLSRAMSSPIEGTVVVITGASSGLGEAAARMLSARGAKVVLGAVSDLHPDNAEVLLFINQTTTSQENPDGAFAASSVKVGLTKIDGNWLIDSFDPV